MIYEAPARRPERELRARPTIHSVPTSTRFDPIAPLASLAGVGPARAARLARLGIESVRDLLLVQPRRLVEWPRIESLGVCSSAQGRACVRAGTCRARAPRAARR
jgi:RecG-like helicase